MNDRLPWGKFVWAHYESDEALALCSMAAQGLWMRLLCIAAKEEGYVLIGGRAPTTEKLARIARTATADVETWLAELEEEGVFSRTGDGVIYSRRMVREARDAKKNRTNGAKGGNPRLRKDTTNIAADNPPLEPQPEPTKEPDPESGLRQRREEVEEKREDVEPDGSPPAGAGNVRKSDIDNLWALAPRKGRERSSKGDVDRALKAAVKRGHSPAEILAGVESYYGSREATRDGGEYAKGLHRLIENDRWQEFSPNADAQTTGHGLGFGPSLRNPSPERQRMWMNDFKASPRAWREHERGPPPGTVGCQVAPEIQREFGIEIAGPQAVRA